MSYPKAVILKRLTSELRECSKYLDGDTVIDPKLVEFPIVIEMLMRNILGYETKDKIISDHRFAITITRDYGERKPEVRWRTHIFHPNIMDPDDGGYVCIKLLNEWSYGTRLSSFIKSIEVLVSEPNYRSPFTTGSCIEAAEFFKENTTKFSASITYGEK